MTRKYLKLLVRIACAVYVVTTAGYALAAEVSSPVPVEVSQVVSSVWPEGKGTFRAINFWKKLRPRLVVESISNAKAIYSADITFIEIDGRRIDVTNQELDAFIENVSISKNELSFCVEAYPQNGSSFAAECHLSLQKQTPPDSAKCVRRDIDSEVVR